MAPAEFESRRATLIAYLRVKCDQSDWHGVSDAANDLRVLEAEMGYANMNRANEAAKSICTP